MRTSPLLALLALWAPLAAADCIPVEKAPEQVGSTACVRGKVLKVATGPSGTHFLNFCADYRKCPFAVVVFPDNLRDVGDVRWLEGKEIEIEGPIKLYKGQAEIVLRDARQLRGQAAKLPPIPKDYDAERRGKQSAGKFGRARERRDKSPTPINPSGPDPR